MVAVLAHADLVVGNDSGPIHVAAALGRPVLGIYGPTDPAAVGPYGQLDQVVRSRGPIPASYRRADRTCINAIAIDTVVEKLAAMVKAGVRGQGSGVKCGERPSVPDS